MSSGDASAEAGGAGGAAAGAKQPPPHSPSMKSSEWPLASRWKPGSREGGSILRGSRPLRCSRCWLDVLSPNSHSTLASVHLRARRPHALPRLSHATSFVMCVCQCPSLSPALPGPPQPSPAHCQALERSGISVCFDYTGQLGDVSQAGQAGPSPLRRARWCVPKKESMNQSC